MKTISRIFTVFFAAVITSPVSMGMGYPQDLFAEHVTTKPVTTRAPSKKVRKFESMDAQKAACLQAAQGVNLKGTMPGKSKSLPKKNKDNHQFTS